MNEPVRVGSVVIDGFGIEWVRVHRHGGPAPWHRVVFDQSLEPWSVWSAIPEPIQINDPVEELTEALRYTVEYIGVTKLPPISGWSWYDAMVKYAPHKAESFQKLYYGSKPSRES